MKRLPKVIGTLALLLSSLSTVPTAHAGLKARSAAIDPATGYPTWYQDTNNLALTNCLDQNGFCLAAAPNLPATKAAINATNFPDESFYYMADTSGTSPGGVINLGLWETALEAAFATNVVDGGQAVFSRIRIRADITIPGTYTVTHPYGVDTFEVTTIDDGPEINFSEDVPGLVAGFFDNALDSRVGPFLTRADGILITDPLTGNRYIGQPGAPVAITGSPFGTNFVQITGTNTADVFRSDTFSLQGKVIGLDVAPKTSINLGKTTIPATSAPQVMTVTNTTGSPISFGALATSGTNAADFIIDLLTNTCTTNIAASASCSFSITFKPSDGIVATRSASILLNPTTDTVGGANPPPVTINLSGTAQYPLTVTIVPTATVTPGNNGTGKVTSSPAGILDCAATSGTCTASFDAGFNVDLTPAGVTTPRSIFHGWTGACNGTTTPCRVTMDGAKSVQADFIRIYNLATSATPAAGGTISSSGTIEHGNSQSITITPTSNETIRYRLLSVLDDGIEVATAAIPDTNSFTYSVENVIDNHNIVATFKQQFFLTPSLTGVGGTITPPARVTVDDGATSGFEITPSAGYRIGTVLDNNVPLAVTVTPFEITISPVKADHNITASFVKIWNVTTDVNANGKVDKIGSEIVDENSTPAYTFTPNKKFQLGSILVDGVSKSFTKPAAIDGAVTVTLGAVKADTTVTGVFVPSGDLDGNGVVNIADAIKAMRIHLKTQAKDADDDLAVKVAPLHEVTGLPVGTGSSLANIIMILKRAVGLVSW